LKNAPIYTRNNNAKPASGKTVARTEGSLEGLLLFLLSAVVEEELVLLLMTGEIRDFFPANKGIAGNWGLEMQPAGCHRTDYNPP
jgi:hypothetical protein